jgi:hypothetical protein
MLDLQFLNPLPVGGGGELCTELEYVKLIPIAVLLVLQNRYSPSCIAIGFRRCYAVKSRKRSNSLNL